MKELEELEREFPEFVTKDSPTQRVGADPSKSFQSFKHPRQMYSLSNALNRGEFFRFLEKTKHSDSMPKFSCEHKFDGLAIELIYENGILTNASTRGNGEIGENITKNARTIRSIPLRLMGNSPSDLIVYGEVLMFKEDFKRLNREREAKGKEPFSNPRNAAAGSLRQLNPKITAERNLKFYAYAVYFPKEQHQQSLSHFENISKLTEWGFPVSDHRILTDNREEIVKYHSFWEKERKTLPYEIDGIVVKIDNLKLQQSFGYDAKSPKWAIAWKFKASQSLTLLREVQFSVGRWGSITPTAIFDPVFIGGAKISRASLHNFDEIKRLDVRIGDTVVVERSGEVIPKIVSVDLSKRPENAKIISPPKNCPSCGSPLVHLEEVAYRCLNTDCPAQIKEKLKHFVSGNGFDIEGLGEEIISRLFELGYIRRIEDIFKLKEHREELISIEGFGEKSVSNLISAIEKSKEIEYAKFINALGIRYVGEQTARLLAEKFQPVEKLIQAKFEDLIQIEGIGEIVAQSLLKTFSIESNQKLIESLLQQGLKIQYPDPIQDQPLKGKTLVFTGKSEFFTREEFKNYAASLGARVSSGVSKKTDFLIVGQNPGSKLQKAQSLGIPVLSDVELMQIKKLKKDTE